MDTGSATLREWQGRRLSAVGGIFSSLILGGGALWILLHASLLKVPHSPGFELAFLTMIGIAAQIVRVTRHLLLQVALFAIPVTLVVLFLRSHGAIDRELNVAAGLYGMGYSAFALATSWKRLRSPLFLRLTETGIERGGYLDPTPPIPYAEIERVVPVPLEKPQKLAVVLRDDSGFLRSRGRWLSRLVNSYDLAIGEDVGAGPIELLNLIRDRLPDPSLSALHGRPPEPEPRLIGARDFWSSSHSPLSKGYEGERREIPSSE